MLSSIILATRCKLMDSSLPIFNINNPLPRKEPHDLTVNPEELGNLDSSSQEHSVIRCKYHKLHYKIWMIHLADV